MSVASTKPSLLVSALQPQDYPLVWQWLNEFPQANFDDYCPQTELEFVETMLARQNAHGQYVMGFREGEDLVGLTGFMFLNPEVAQLQGILFPKSVHGTGLPQEAFTLVLQLLQDLGVRKLCATYPANNTNIASFLQRFGAQVEGYQKAQTKRNGEPVDLKQVALFLE